MYTRYQDRWIECTQEEVKIRGYYLRWATKRIPYSAIRSVEFVDLDALSARGPIGVTVNPRYRAHPDPDRPKKRVGLILDLGRFGHPFITPDDPEAVEAVIREHGWLGPADGDAGRRPVV
jgi:hypothetical protein